MSLIKHWFEEVSHKREAAQMTYREAQHFIYRGFKLSKVGETYTVVDVRTNNFYSDVKASDMEVFRERGFIAGADYLMYRRDCRRVTAYDKQVSKLTADKQTYYEKLPQNQPFYKKKISNCIVNLEIATELLAFYTARKMQIGHKYNFLTTTT